MLQLFFNIILTMLYMGYTPLAWNPYTTPQIVATQLSVECMKLGFFVIACWTIITVVLLIVKLIAKLK